MLKIDKDKIFWGFWQERWIYKIDGFVLLLKDKLSFDTKYIDISVTKVKEIEGRIIDNINKQKSIKFSYCLMDTQNYTIKDYLKLSIEQYLDKYYLDLNPENGDI